MQGRKLGEELIGQMAGLSSNIGCTLIKYSETGDPTLRTFRTATKENIKVRFHTRGWGGFGLLCGMVGVWRDFIGID